ncbi:hypothetical protein ACHAWU_006281 [Discostella pseudostelligera]|uniref:Uncharacterized protein n=1 Tax=Discostella pseudostelligera TaxID=259834 RepID=A0ABD3MBI5_9STRA
MSENYQEENINITENEELRLPPPPGRSPATRASSLGERSTSNAEQEPEMRSVTIQREHRLQRVDANGRLIAHTKSHPSPTRIVQLKPSSSSPSVAPVNTTINNTTGSARARSWDVDHATLPTRPDDFPLLPTTRIVHGMNAGVISNCISDCLRIRSVKMTLCKSQGNLARCLNTDFCRFNVRLYSTNDGAVLVEVHRLTGDAVSFMRDCRAVFNAAEGKSLQQQSKDEDVPMYLRFPVSQMNFLGSLSLPPPLTTSQDEYAESIKCTSELLSSHMTDSNMLGMESLVIQTDPLKTDKSSAMNVSRRILSPSDEENDGFNLHNHLMSILLCNEDSHVMNAEGHQAGEEASLSQAYHVTKLRNLAMLALSNALELFSSENLLTSTISSDLEWYTSNLIPTLIHDLNMAVSNPHYACYASRCLSTLAKSSVELAHRMKDSGGLDAVKIAEEVGTREFAMLAHDARTCRESLCVGDGME